MENKKLKSPLVFLLLLFSFKAVLAATPNNIYPGAGISSVSTTPIFEISCDTTDLSGHYQISDNALFSTLVYDSGELTHDICTHLTTTKLSPDSVYFWRARTSDSSTALSTWSAPTSFSTIAASVKTGIIEFRDGVAGYSGTTDADIRGSYANPLVAIREWNQGAQAILRMGRRPAGSITDEIYRSLVAFDLTSISPGTTIVSAYIEMADGPPHSDNTVFRQPFEAYTVYKSWGEGSGIKAVAPTSGEISWTYNAYTNTWNAPGLAGPGDRSVVPLYGGAVTNQSGSKYVGSSGTFIQEVQDWISNPSQNYGIFMQAVNENRRNNANLGSREDDDRDIRPRLVVEAIVTTAADISIVTGASTLSPATNDTISLTVSITNSSTDDATGLTVTSGIPSGFSLITSGSTAGSYNSGSGLWTIASVASGVTETLTLNGTVTTATQIDFDAELISVDQLDPDSYPDNSRPTEDDQDAISLIINASLMFADSSMTFIVAPGLTDSQSINLAMSNGTSVSYTVSDNAFWLSTLMGTGTTPDSITVNVDTTGLSEGSYSADITASSTGIPGAILQVNLVVGSSVLGQTFDTDPGNFAYNDDTFYGTNQSSYASGNYAANGGLTGGAIRIVLGGIDNSTVNAMSSGWTSTFNLAGATDVAVIFSYRMILTSNYEADECSQVLVSIDGTIYDNTGTNSFIEQICGTDSVLDSGWKTVVISNVALAAGSHTLTLGGYNNKKTRANESTQIFFDEVNIFTAGASLLVTPSNLNFTLVPGASDTQALNLSTTDATTVSYTVVDDATWLSLNQTAGSTPDSINVTADSTGLADGNYSASITISATGFADSVANVNLLVGQSSLLFGASNVNFSLSPGETDTQAISLSSSNGSPVSFTLSDDATWLNLVAGVGTTNDTISVNVDSMGLADGSYSATMTASAAGYTDATATVNLTVGSSIISEDFTVSAGGFTYADDAFYSTSEPAYASGNYNAGAGNVRVLLGGLNSTLITDMSGAWSTSFDLSAATAVKVSFRYRLALTANYESDECSQALFSIDNILYDAAGANTFLQQICGTDATLDSGWQTVTVDVSLLAGSHTLALGGYNNQKTRANETTQVFFDDINIVNGTPSLQLSQSNLNFNVIPGAGATQQISISTTAGTVAYSIGDDATWLTVTPGTGTTPDTINVDIDSTGLPEGTYSGTITASATGLGDALTTVNLNVSQPALVLGSTSLSYSLESGANGTQPVSIVTNDASSVAYSAISDATWLTLVPGTGITPDTISADVDTAGLPDGDYTASITLSAAGFNDAIATVSLSVSSTLFSDNFASSAGVFTYADDAFYGTSEPGYASGNFDGSGGVSDGAVRVLLGGLDASTITGMSGGWSSTMSVASATTIAVTLNYRIELSLNYESDECSQALFSVDGVLYDPTGANTYLEEICGTDSVLNSGWKTVTVNLSLLPGTHTLTLGGYNNQKTRSNETTEVFFDDISIVTGSPSLIFDMGSLTFDLLPGASAMQTINLSAIDAASVAYGVGDDATWLTLNTGSGVTPEAINVTVDTTGLANGSYTATITATAVAYADATTTVNLTVSNNIFLEDFNSSAGSFTYADDTFLGTSEPIYASGSYTATGGNTGGAVRVNLGGVNDNNILDMSGGWTSTFNLASAATVTVVLSYRVTANSSYEADECIDAIVTLDGTMYDGSGANSFLAQVCGDDPVLDSGWQTASFSVSLTAGTHTLTIGGYNNKKTKANESGRVYIDDISVSS